MCFISALLSGNSFRNPVTAVLKDCLPSGKVGLCCIYVSPTAVSITVVLCLLKSSFQNVLTICLLSSADAGLAACTENEGKERLQKDKANKHTNTIFFIDNALLFYNKYTSCKIKKEERTLCLADYHKVIVSCLLPIA